MNANPKTALLTTTSTCTKKVSDFELPDLAANHVAEEKMTHACMTSILSAAVLDWARLMPRDRGN
jgi:hypothetical protein